MQPRPGSLSETRADRAIALAAFSAGVLIYGLLAWRLARGEYSEYYNLAFDFDPAAYRSLFSGPLGAGGAFKHPLISLVGLLVRPLIALGVPLNLAAAIPSVLAGSAALSLCYLTLRAWGIGRPEAAACLVLYGVTATQIIASMIPESYALALFSIALVWWIAAVRLKDAGRLRRARYVAGVLAFGVTITNAVQPLIAEGAVLLERLRPKPAFARLVAFGMILGFVCGLIWIVVQHDNALWAAQHPLLALKHAYWQRTTGWRTGPGMVLGTFAEFSFVSPRFVTVLLADGLPMQDFRSFDYSAAGAAAALLWGVFLAVGTAAALANRRARPLALGLLACAGYSLALHLRIQFRGSLFIYAAHAHFALFALACGAVHGLRQTPRNRAAYIGFVLALAGLFGTVNIGRAYDLATRFDHVNVPCPKPCS